MCIRDSIETRWVVAGVLIGTVLRARRATARGCEGRQCRERTGAAHAPEEPITSGRRPCRIIGACERRVIRLDDRFERAKALFFAALASHGAGELGQAERQYQSSLELV